MPVSDDVRKQSVFLKSVIKGIEQTVLRRLEDDYPVTRDDAIVRAAVENLDSAILALKDIKGRLYEYLR